MLSSVNPKTDAEKNDRIRIGAILRLDDDENRAGLLLKPRCLVEEERADMTSVNGPFEKSRPNGLMSEFEGRPDLSRTWNFGTD